MAACAAQAQAQGPAADVAAPTAPARLSPAAVADVLAQPLASRVSVPATRGALDLKGRRFYIAEYRVLIEHAGERVLEVRDGQVMGQPIGGPEVTLAFRSQPDWALLQALVDRGHRDLLARLAAAGIEVTPAEQITREHGAIHSATEPGATEEQLVETEATSGSTLRRYLHFSPQGMKLIKPTPGGIGVGDLVARLAYRNHRLEALSLTMAINLGGVDGASNRRSSFTSPPGSLALSPQMELGPAPSASLVYAHGQVVHINLVEAFALTPEFGRLRPAVAGEEPPRNALTRWLDLGRNLTGGSKRLDAVLELDGASTARLVMYCLGAANQAIANALAAAR